MNIFFPATDYSYNTAPLSPEERDTLIRQPVFGKVFTEHMFVAHWNREKGWHKAQLLPRQSFAIDLAAQVFHYGQEIFEGMKAFHTADGRIVLFRPDKHAKRFQSSAARLTMPRVEKKDFIEAVKLVVSADKDWVSSQQGCSLYIRPFMFASEGALGVHSASDFIFCVLASPVKSYFENPSLGLSIWVEQHYARAILGGTGAVKCGGNYAAGFLAQQIAKKNGCDQILFLDAIEKKWIEELGAMNIFFVTAQQELITPALTGTILPGITRDSLINIAKDHGLKVHERAYSFEELKQDHSEGKVVEAFGCGTAAGVAPIHSFVYEQGKIAFSPVTGPSLVKELRNRLVSLQRGAAKDHRSWLELVCRAESPV